MKNNYNILYYNNKKAYYFNKKYFNIKYKLFYNNLNNFLKCI